MELSRSQLAIYLYRLSTLKSSPELKYLYWGLFQAGVRDSVYVISTLGTKSNLQFWTDIYFCITLKYLEENLISGPSLSLPPQQMQRGTGQVVQHLPPTGHISTWQPSLALTGSDGDQPLMLYSSLSPQQWLAFDLIENDCGPGWNIDTTNTQLCV